MNAYDYDVTALGELLVDFTESGSSAQGNPVLEANPGGAPCNVLAMLARLGRRTAFLGKVGNDAFGALLKASPMLFDVLRYAGVAYLVWLGIKAWRAPIGGDDSGAQVPAPPSLGAMYATGLGTGFSNPKLIVFAAALFPQFIDTTQPFVPTLRVIAVRSRRRMSLRVSQPLRSMSSRQPNSSRS